MNFDWYGASLDVDARQTASEASRAFDLASWYPTRPRNGFGQAQELRRGDTRLATMLWENQANPTARTCYIEASGRHAAKLAEWVRSFQPCHRVARADVAEDYSAPGMWERLSGIGLEVADLHGVKVEHAGDHHRALDGRSIYLGGRTSVVRAIVYEKGKQIGGDPNHVRVELRTRPGTRLGKFQAASLTPQQFYGGAAWSAELGTRLGCPEVARVSLGTVYRDEDVERSRQALLKQYHRVLRGLHRDLGSWSDVGIWVGEQLAQGGSTTSR